MEGAVLHDQDEKHRELWQLQPTLSSKARVFAGLVLRALGIVYGDIGTSPLYVFSTLFALRPPQGDSDFIGASSIVVCLGTFSFSQALNTDRSGLSFCWSPSSMRFSS